MFRYRSTALAAVLLAAAVACAPGREPGAAEPFPRADVLMEADRAFARASAARGTDAWSEVWAEHGMLYGTGSEPVVGPGATAQAISGLVDRLRWEPDASAMLWPDSLGYTVGRRWMAPGTPDAPENDAARRYVTVWQQTDGEWNVALDVSFPAGDDPADRDFDFWLGDWSLAQSIWSGEGDRFEAYDATNRVRAIEGGGALVESFSGDVRFFWAGMAEPAPIRGASVRYYDNAAGRWRIFWIDTVARRFGPPFTGVFSGGTGEFLVTGGPDGMPPRRIRFEPRADGTIDWELAITSPEGQAWQPLWTIEFRPAS